MPDSFESDFEPNFVATEKKSSRASKSSKNDMVDTAVEMLTELYNLPLFPLMGYLPKTAVAWNKTIPSLEARNRAILSTHPDLAERIVATSSKTGMPALIMSNLLGIVPIALLGYNEFMDKRMANAENDEESENDDSLSA